MGAEEYIESLPMWAKKKNTVQQVREFLGMLLQEEAPVKESLPSGDGPWAETGLRTQHTGPRIPIIHVAGTNGKGSVCAYLTQAFLDSGLHVGTFISPHLVDVKERILLDNVPVDGARFEAACEKVKALAERVCVTPETAAADAAANTSAAEAGRTGGSEDDGPAWPTYFEYLYYMAMCVFQDAAVDVIVLETGLGGRLDATNSCDPVLTEDENLPAVRSALEETAAEMDSRITLHDIRIVPGNGADQVRFDCVIPYGMKLSGQEAQERFNRGVRQRIYSLSKGAGFRGQRRGQRGVGGRSARGDGRTEH